MFCDSLVYEAESCMYYIPRRVYKEIMLMFKINIQLNGSWFS